MPLIIPLQPVPNQTLQIVLDNQSCVINVYHLDYGLFVDVLLGNSLVVSCVIALNNTRLVRESVAALGSPGFSGDFAFEDASGAGEDPVYTGLGSQFFLMYYFEYELD
jgi:hypothetical protein